MIKITDLKKSYKKNQTIALHNINVEFPDQGMVCIIGPSGCGKTTLLNIISGMDSKDMGTICINNVDTNTFKQKDWDDYRNKYVGYIYQNYNLVSHMTIYENIELKAIFSNISSKRKKIYDLCDKLNIKHLLNKKPHELSGGEQQRACIARCLINDPQIILADEPTGALDSNNSTNIMNILKELSKEKLVIVVTHNNKLAQEYSDYQIEMLDGKIIKNTIVNSSNKKEYQKEGKLFLKLAFFKLGLKSLYNKKIRSIITILSCGIGILSLCLVLTVSNGMSLYVTDVQKEALSTYPITISNVVIDDEEEVERKTYEDYPDEEKIHIVNDNISYTNHVNNFTNNFISYIRDMPSEIYTTVSYGGALSMRILSEFEDSYKFLSTTSYMKETTYDLEYLKEEYDLLTGVWPTTINELSLVVDKNNCLDVRVLNALGIDFEDREYYTFSEILNKEFKVITNDLYYYNNGEYYTSYSRNGKTLEDLYTESEITLKITSIVRPKASARTKLYRTCLLYTSHLTDYIHNLNLNSQIVIDQLNYGVEKNVLTGEAFADQTGLTYVISKEYLYESTLVSLGANYSLSYMYIYADSFENFSKVKEYIDAYNQDKDENSKIIYSDRLSVLTNDFEVFMSVLTEILLIFSLISLVVSAVMIAIITYTSVREKTKEIGIMRSLGAKRSDIASLVLTENFIVGFFSGVIGIIGAKILIKPILSKASEIMVANNITSFDATSMSDPKFSVVHIILLIIGSAVVAVASGVSSAIIAANMKPVDSINKII